MDSLPPTVDRMLRVRGTVQGIGFRPFVLRLARELGVDGWVKNDAVGVLIRAIGEAETLERFGTQIVMRQPPAARVTSVGWLDDTPDDSEAIAGFHILESTAASGEIETAIPVDLAPCADCMREMCDPENRRYQYPFINCTQCGPRYSIIESLPYDRPRTTMRGFSMCPDCLREYADPSDRRFHAEPNACPACGPVLNLTDNSGKSLARGDAGIAMAVDFLIGGGILAAKGVGGFHLMADATNQRSVFELRRHKHREEKPFAVMFRDLDMLRLWADVSGSAAELLVSPQAPIVLVGKKSTAELAESVAPGNPWIGALLPSSPMHWILMEKIRRPLVATSANHSEEPLCYDNDEARERLGGIAELFLTHNREVARPIDDSVVRFTPAGSRILLRRARGYAPAPVELPSSLPHPVLCVGAQMKNTVAVASGQRLVISPHIGDLGGVATHEVFTRTIHTLQSLLASDPRMVVCDKHPDYHSTRHAIESGLPVISVQHHLAHVLAVLLEHRHPPDGVLGVAWDGTGYGEDGTIWGGEFILLQGGVATRFARLRPFRLPGGEASVKDARRMAVALAHACDASLLAKTSARFGFSSREADTLRTMMDQGIHSPVCSSIGRMFDGFAALAGLGNTNFFEGQLPLAVETAALASPTDTESLPFSITPSTDGVCWEMDWTPAILPLLSGPERPACALSAAFHRGLADALVEVCRLSGVRTVVLSGGCFQNALLRDLAESGLVKSGMKVLAPIELPSNDGAIAAGQALAALWNLTTVEPPQNPPPPCASPFQEK